MYGKARSTLHKILKVTRSPLSHKAVIEDFDMACWCYNNKGSVRWTLEGKCGHTRKTIKVECNDSK